MQKCGKTAFTCAAETKFIPISCRNTQLGSLNLMVTKAFSHAFHSYPFSTSPSISQEPVLICMGCTLAHKRTWEYLAN